jgi:hypothetical protein
MKTVIIRSFLGSLVFLVSTTAFADNCPGPEKMKLDVGLYSLGLQEKKPICVLLGGAFKIEIKVQNNSGITLEKGDVTAEQKLGSSVMIEGSNAVDEDELVVWVTGDLPDDPIGQFWIKVKGVGELDPKVRVVDNDVMLRVQYDAISGLLSDLGIDWDTAMQLFRDFDDSK